MDLLANNAYFAAKSHVFIPHLAVKCACSKPYTPDTYLVITMGRPCQLTLALFTFCQTIILRGIGTTCGGFLFVFFVPEIQWHPVL